MKVLVVLCLAVLATVSASPWRHSRPRDMSKIVFRTPKVPAHTIKLLKQEEVKVNIPVPTEWKDFRAVCGKTTLKESRIVGGEEATPHEFPWQVGIFLDGFSFCGGSLISDEWVLTAAHCADGISFFNVVFGSHYITDNSEEGRVEVLSTEKIVHEGWNPFTLANDIALVRLPQPVAFNDIISPVCLPRASDVGNLFVGTLVTPSGWGQDSDAGSGISPVLRKVTVPILDSAPCNDYYGIITDSIVCLDTTGGHGVCFGDSGGPLNHAREDGSCVETLGVTSFVASAGCESGFPHGYTRLTSFLDWVSGNTGIVIEP